MACIWADDAGSNINWHLGVVNRYDYDKDELFVSYMKRTAYIKRTDAKETQWLFPEERESHITQDEQVIKRNVSVWYSLTAIMRCSLDKKQYQDIVECFQVLLLLLLLIMIYICFSLVNVVPTVNRLYSLPLFLIFRFSYRVSLSVNIWQNLLKFCRLY